LGWYQVSYTMPQHFFSLLSANVLTICFFTGYLTSMFSDIFPLKMEQDA
jgi:hypothetical protein